MHVSTPAHFSTGILNKIMGCITILELLITAVLFCNSSPVVHGTIEYHVIPTEYNGISCPGA